MRANLVDMGDPSKVLTGPFLTCTQYNGGVQGGSYNIALYYQVYWQRPNDNIGYYNYSGVAYVPKMH